MREIRDYRAEDEADAAAVWHRSGLQAYTYLPPFQALTVEKARQVFRDVIAARCRMWVGEQDGRIAAYLAMDDDYIDRLYVDPAHQRSGWGRELVIFAKDQSPRGLRLHTHQKNVAARALYESEGFRAVKFGLSPPPESEPDVEYHWEPADEHR